MDEAIISKHLAHFDNSDRQVLSFAEIASITPLDRLNINPVAMDFIARHQGLVFYSLIGESAQSLRRRFWEDFEDNRFDVEGNACVNTNLREVFRWYENDYYNPIIEGIVGARFFPVATHFDNNSHAFLGFDTDGDLYLCDLDRLIPLGKGIDDFWRFALRRELKNIQERAKNWVPLQRSLYKSKIISSPIPEALGAPKE